ncbi:MAG: flotillin-like FloA family protein, partial [Pirellula sp.]
MRTESLLIFAQQSILAQQSFLAQQGGPQLTAQSALLIVLLIFGALAALVCLSLLWNFGSLWIQAMMSGADVSMPSLIGMYFRQVRSSVIVNAKVMA